MTTFTVSRLNPFPGLRPFEPEEEHLFFGRETQIDALLGRLRLTHFLAVVGTSGSGKSSLLRAGMLPALNGGLMSGAGSRWRIALMKPGSEPLDNLARALTGSVMTREPDPGDARHNTRLTEELTRAVLSRGPLGIVEIVRQARLDADENVLVVVDQFEEIFRFKGVSTADGHADEAAAFVKLLLAAAAHQPQPIFVALTMRSDFLGDCAQFRDLPEAVNDGLFLVPRMTRAQLRSAIEGPIGVAGGRIAPRLVARLLNDLGDDPDQLPVLAHALMRTWNLWAADHRPGEAIELRHYEPTGGLSQALSLHADEIYNGLESARSREVCEKLFKCLTDPGTDKRGVRRPRTFSRACAIAAASPEEVRRVVDAFRAPDCSFLMPPAGTEIDDDTMLDISHESLMRVWKQLQKWVEHEAESAKIYLRLAESASLYALGKASLMRDPELSSALGWRDTNHPTSAWAHSYHPAFDDAMAFLDRSAAERKREAAATIRARRRQSRYVTSGLLLLALLAVGLIVLLLQWGNAQKRLALASQEAAARSAADAYRISISAHAALLAKNRESRAALAASRAKLEAEKQASAARRAERYALSSAVLATKESQQAAVLAGVAEADRAEAKRQAKIAEKEAARLEQLVNESKAATAFYKGSTANDISEAIRDYTQALKLRKEYVIAYFQRGLQYEIAADQEHLAADYTLAIADFNDAIRLKPDSAQAYAQRGEVHVKQSDFDSAIADFDQAIKYAPNNASAYVQLASAYQQKGDNDGAIADFQRMIVQRPTAEPAYAQLSGSFLRMKQPDGFKAAIQAYSTFISTRPSIGSAYRERAAALTRLAEYDRDPTDRTTHFDAAIADYNEAIELDGQSGQAYLGRANTYLAMTKPQAAIADFGAAIDHGVPEARFQQAMAFEQTGDYRDAIDDYAQLQQLWPNSTLYYLREGVNDERIGDAERARAAYDKAIRRGGTQATTAYIQRASLNVTDGRFDAAQDDYNHAALNQTPSYIDLYRGVAHFDAMRFAQASTDFDNFKKVSPTSAKDAYVLAWAALTNAKLGLPVDDANPTDAGQQPWPEPAVALFAGHSTVDGFLAAARGYTSLLGRTTCEANFFAGEYLLLHQDAAGAQTYLTTAVQTCNKTYAWIGGASVNDSFFGYAAARAELNRLPRPPAGMQT